MRSLPKSPNRIVALALGVAFAGYGVFAVVTSRPLLGALFTVAAAALLVGALGGIASARVVNIVAGAAWLLLGYAGLFLVGTTFNVLGLSALDEVVLFAAATGLLAVGLGAREDVGALPHPAPRP
jgi:hypothetical protein